MVRRILLILLIIFVIIQFIRPARNLSNVVSSNDIAKLYVIPDTVQNILKVSCYDCHSNNTNYPWYSNIQPVGWWLQWHVNDGKKELNYSEFGSYEPRRQWRRLKQTAELAQKHEMPLDSYLWIHKESKLSETQIKLLSDWAESLAEKIRVDKNVDTTRRQPVPSK
ncbi:MAG TPA: heme-binding domain-containing protein [Chitinophagaceae bacterium]|nr:heme-binding domain-containing protein [Chitinophagaceae bacterium]